VAVVVNEKNSVVNLNNTELRSIFAGEKHYWPSGVPIRVFVRAPGAEERTALLKLLDMTEDQYKKYWTAQILTGEDQAEPVVLFSNGVQRNAIVSYIGSIALVSAQDLRPGMKVVKLDGRLPGEPGYTLH
jgi:ABC-type phosphate transport system substrate-binding protein